MSFGRSSGMMAAGGGEQPAIGALGVGTSNVGAAGNFFSSLLSGNRANTMTMLQPDIERIRQATQGNLQAASTLMPRGGGRFATLFQQPFAAQQQIGNLFNTLRAQAPMGLAQIGGEQARIGQTAASNLFQQDLAQKEMLNNFIQGIAQSALGAGASLAKRP